MIVDPGESDNNPTPQIAYIGNATTKEPAFFIGATEGSTVIHSVSTTTTADASAFDDERYTVHDISETIGAVGISTISPCRSPLTSGYTVGKSGYMCNGDGTIDRDHISCLLYTSPSPRDQRGSGLAGSA